MSFQTESNVTFCVVGILGFRMVPGILVDRFVECKRFLITFQRHD
jgi:hypothetical protein